MADNDTVCFWVEPTGRCRRFLRRYAPSSKCPLPHGYHDASTAIEDAPVYEDTNGVVWLTPDFKFVEWTPVAPRWPVVCACGYQFTERDERQLSHHPIYRASDGREFTLHEPVAGMMLRARWNEPEWAGPDGQSIIVYVPPGQMGDQWCIDGPSNKNPPGCWQREGTPPRLTVKPSIQTPRFHGYLTDGVLRPC